MQLEKDYPEFFSQALEEETPSIRRIIDVGELEKFTGLKFTELKGIAEEVRNKIFWGVYGDLGELTKISEMRNVEHLTDTDENAELFRTLYLKGLKEEPSAFGSTFESESRKSKEDVKAFLRSNYAVGVKFGFQPKNKKQKGSRLVALGAYKRKEGVESHIATLGKIYVRPTHRKRNLAGNILRNLLDHAMADGVEQVHLTVTASNDFAIQFYEKHGFVRGEIQSKAIKIDDEYYDWLPMKLSVHHYKSEKMKSAPKLT